MYHPPIFFDPQFTFGVMAGWVLTLAGVGALLLAGVWYSFAGEWRRGTPPRRPPRAPRSPGSPTCTARGTRGGLPAGGAPDRGHSSEA